MVAVYVEAGLKSDVPLGWHQRAESSDEVAAQEWLATAEGDSAARGEKVDVVYRHLVEQLAYRRLPPYAFGHEALRVEAIPAMQRTGVEGDECGHSHAVGS